MNTSSPGTTVKQIGARVLSLYTFRSVGPYVISAVICLLVLCFMYQLPTTNLRIPLVDYGDATFYDMVVKNFVETGHYYINPLLGAPGQQEMYDFPIPHAAHLLGIAILRLFTHDYALVINLYYLLTYPLIAMTAFYTFRRLGISDGLGIAGCVLFAFLPFHVLRSQGHLIHTSYYVVPFVILAVLWVTHGHPLFRFDLDRQAYATLPLITTDGILSLVVCILVASDNPYWTFFSGIFLIAGGFLGRFRYGHHRALYSASVLAVVLLVTFVINLSPNIVYAHKHGLNPVNHRVPAEAEIYGGRITQMVLPVSYHRVRFLAQWKAAYDAGAPLVNENYSASLGIAGTLGFLVLLGCFFVSRSQDLLDSLSILNLTAILIGTIGGLGAVFSLVVWSQFRGYNRISVYIGFFSLCALLLTLDRVLKGRLGSAGEFGRLLGIPVILLAVGLLDEIPTRYLPNRSVVETNYLQDQLFIEHIESMVPLHSMIFELPYVAFLGSVPSNTAMIEYDEFKGYLHSASLRWSGGAVINRATDLLIAGLAAKPADEMVFAASEAGFAGIYVDRYGYVDHGKVIESELRRVLQVDPIVSQNGRRSFFLLDPSHLASLQRSVKSPTSVESPPPQISVATGDGCWPLEGTPELNWHWCGQEGEIIVVNPSNNTMTVRLEMLLMTGRPEMSSIAMRGPGFRRTVHVNNLGADFSADVLARPGESVFHLASDAKSFVASGDPRTLVFQIRNLRLSEQR